MTPPVVLSTLPPGWHVIASQRGCEQWAGIKDAKVTVAEAHKLVALGLLLMAQRAVTRESGWTDGYDLVVRLSQAGQQAVRA